MCADDRGIQFNTAHLDDTLNLQIVIQVDLAIEVGIGDLIVAEHNRIRSLTRCEGSDHDLIFGGIYEPPELE